MRRPQNLKTLSLRFNDYSVKGRVFQTFVTFSQVCIFKLYMYVYEWNMKSYLHTYFAEILQVIYKINHVHSSYGMSQ